MYTFQSMYQVPCLDVNMGKFTKYHSTLFTDVQMCCTTPLMGTLLFQFRSPVITQSTVYLEAKRAASSYSAEPCSGLKE